MSAALIFAAYGALGGAVMVWLGRRLEREHREKGGDDGSGAE